MKRICCFAGHSIIYNKGIIKDIRDRAAWLIKNNGVEEFWLGGYGEFDKYAYNAMKQVKNIYHDIKLVYVVPYHSKVKPNDKNKYDEIMVANVPEKTPIKYRIIKTNEFIVDNADYMICYVDYDFGGAYHTYKYAKHNKKTVIYNLSNTIL